MLWVLFTSLLCFTLVCSDYHLSERKNSSCSYQLWSNKSKDACKMTYFLVDSAQCWDELPETPTTNTPKRSFVKLVPFMALRDTRTVFNITVHNITWTNFKMRFRQQNTKNCMKREFFINGTVPNDKFLIYDTPWSLAEYENKTIDFEYSYGVNNKYDGKRTFIINVPLAEKLDNFLTTNVNDLSLFTYLETTNLYQIVLKILTPTQVNIPWYQINVKFKKNNYTKWYGPFIRSSKMAVLNVIDFEYDTFGVPGEYTFYVRPNCSNCFISESPTCIIPESSTVLTIGIVGAFCLIPILLITLFLYIKSNQGVNPRVLLVTTPANGAHKTIGTALEKLLTKIYKMEVMLDINDISLVSKVVPKEWLEASFKNATHVVILISDHKPVTSVYRIMDKYLYNLIENDPKKKCCTIKFPFSEEPNFDYNVRRKFTFKKDYFAFIHFLRNVSFFQQLKHKALLYNNELYNDLLKEIDNYERDIVPEPILIVQSTENECDQNNINNRKITENDCDQHDVMIPIDKYEKVVECLSKNYQLNPKDDENSDSDSDINSTVYSLLEKVS